MPNAISIFDRARVRAHRDRAAEHFEESVFLLREMALRLADRLPDIKKTFPVALDIGAHNGVLGEYLAGVGGIEWLVQSDMSHKMLCHPCASRGIDSCLRRNDNIYSVVADEEWLPFAAGSFDLVMSAGSLHWVNDLPGTLIQINRILKSGGLFLAILPGGETLKELRQSFEQAQMRTSGGISPRVSPFVDVKDAGSLLQRTGFSEPVTDSEIVTVSYADPLQLLHDLRGMGETNALIAQEKTGIARSLLASAMDYYRQHFTLQSGHIAATFEFVTLTAWKADG